ncbi:MAG: hypothetical protein ABIG42_02940 [bacterium]
MNLLEFYNHAKQEVIKAGYQKEIDSVDERRFEDAIPIELFYEYAYVVLNSGMSNKVAERMYKKLLSSGSKTVKHPGKRKAIIQAQIHYKWWFRELKSCGTVREKLDYLDTLPWIGPITKHHLARNLGVDVAKPDRHLQRIAEHFGYLHLKIIKAPIPQGAKIKSITGDVQKMCEEISKETGVRVGTIDVILWRATSLNPPWKAKAKKVPGW